MRANLKNITILGGIGLAACSQNAQQQKPNIIFIMSDDHSSKAISCYGSTLNKTPNIDKLAEEGVQFTNCFCTNAISAPSRASILTGTFNHLNGLYNNYVGFDTSQNSFPKVLRHGGYQTALVGKWHLKTAPSGFDYWNILPGQGHYYNPDFITNGKKQQIDGYVTDIITKDAISWLSKTDTSQAFFLMLNHKAPHRNWLPELEKIENYRDTKFPLPENFHDNYEKRHAAKMQKLSIGNDMELAYDLKIIHPDSAETIAAKYVGLSRLSKKDREKWMILYRQRYDEYIGLDGDEQSLAEYKFQWYMQDYLACIDAVDESVGEIINYLKEKGLYENTIIIYTSDQGFFLGEHGWFDKRFMYEESFGMPLIIRNPKLKQAGQKREQLVMNIDFAPTILEYAGMQIPEQMQGLSICNLLENNDTELRQSVYYHYFEYPGPHNVARHYGIRTDRFKLIHFYHPIDEWELYDLQKDPSENNSVFDDEAYAQIKIELLKELEFQRNNYGDTIKSYPLATKTIKNLANIRLESLKFPPGKKYKGTGENTLHDGIIENITALNPGNYDSWFGFEGNDLNLEWELSQKQIVDTIILRFLDAPNAWIFKPKKIQLAVKASNLEYKEIVLHKIKTTSRIIGGEITEYLFLPGEIIDYLKIDAENIGLCPKGHKGEGQKAWMFIDEIILR